MAITTSGITSPTFTAGGLASGLDTNSIIDQLVALESRPVTLAQNRQAAFQTQISLVADLASKLDDLDTAAAALGTDGVLGVVQQGTATGFSASPSSAANPGSFAVQVDALATPAKARSAGFADGVGVTGGTLTLSVNGTATDIAIADGASLESVAASINQSAAGVSASVLNANGTRYLSLTRRDTGFTPGQAAATALTITESSTGGQGQALGLAITQTATNARLQVDGLSFERSSNTVADVVPGVTLTLEAKTTAPEDLTLASDTTATKTNLQKFVDAYNALMTAVNKQLNVLVGTDTSKTLAGDPALRSLQSSLHRLISGVLSDHANVRTLADVGVKTGNDGTLSIDSARLEKAIAADSQGVNALFQTATTGVAASVKALDTQYTDIVDGVFTQRTSGLKRSVKDLDTQIANLQLRVDGYKKTLVAEFAAMETVVSGFKDIGNFLTQQSNALAASANSSK